MKGLILVAILFAVANAQININFAGLLNGVAPMPTAAPTSAPTSAPTPAPTPAPCTNVTCKPYLSLRRALDAAHVRVAQKGLWTKIYVTDNDQWPNIVYNSECTPDGTRYPFPPKEGALAALLNRGLRVAYYEAVYAFTNGRTNPPTGIDINYINALVSEMRTAYGPFNVTWVPVKVSSALFGYLINRTVDLTTAFNDLGYYTTSRNYSSDSRSDQVMGAGCTAYLEPGMCVVLSSSPYKSYQDLVGAGTKLKVGTLGSSSKLALLPQANIVEVSIDLEFVDMLALIVNGTIDVLWDAVVVASDVAGTSYKLEQFNSIPNGVAVSSKLLTPLDN